MSRNASVHTDSSIQMGRSQAAILVERAARTIGRSLLREAMIVLRCLRKELVAIVIGVPTEVFTPTRRTRRSTRRHTRRSR